MRRLIILAALLAGSAAQGQAYAPVVAPDAQCPTPGASSPVYPSTIVVCWPSGRLLYFEAGVWKEKELPLCSDIDDTDPPAGTDCPSAAVCQSQGAGTWSVYGCDTAGGWQTLSGAGDGVGYDTVQDEGVALTKRGAVNFTGTGVSCVDNAGATRTDCTISGSGGGSPGGTDTQLQFNDAGAFGGTSGTTWDKAASVLSVGKLVVPNGSGSAGASSGTGRIYWDFLNGVLYLGDGADIAPIYSSTGAQNDDAVTVGNGTKPIASPLPPCAGATTDKLLYDAATNTFSCGVDQSGAGGGISTVQEGDVDVSTAASVLDFGPGFDLTETPVGEVNVVLDYTEDPVDLATAEITGILPEANVDALIARDSELHGDGTDCAAGSYARGVDASGNAQLCTADDDAPDSDAEVPNAITLDLTGGAITGGTASRCARFDGTGALVAATGDCPSGDTGGGGGISTVQESDVTVTSAATVLDFGLGFGVTESPAGEANVSLVYSENPVNLGSSDVTGVAPDANVADVLTLSGSTITLKGGTAPTAEGLIEWDTTADRILVGDGVGTQTFYGGAHTTDTTCNDAGVSCAFAGSATEGGAATSADALSADGTDCGVGNYARGIDTAGNATGCTADSTGTDTLDDLSDNVLADLSDVSTAAPATNDVLTFNGTVWGPAAPAGGATDAVVWNLTLFDPSNPADLVNCDGANSTCVLGPHVPAGSTLTISGVWCIVDPEDSLETVTVRVGDCGVGPWSCGLQAASAIDNSGAAATAPASVAASRYLVLDIDSAPTTARQLLCTVIGHF